MRQWAVLGVRLAPLQARFETVPDLRLVNSSDNWQQRQSGGGIAGERGPVDLCRIEGRLTLAGTRYFNRVSPKIHRSMPYRSFLAAASCGPRPLPPLLQPVAVFPAPFLLLRKQL